MKTLSLLLSVLIALMTCSCKHEIKKDEYDIQINFSFGQKFITYKLNETGKGYAFRGYLDNNLKPFKSTDSAASKPFNLVEIEKFNSVLHTIERKPVLDSLNTQDCPRTEIYYKGKKIYDVYYGGSVYWDLFRPIMSEMPQGYNPFKQGDYFYN